MLLLLLLLATSAARAAHVVTSNDVQLTSAASSSTLTVTSGDVDVVDEIAVGGTLTANAVYIGPAAAQRNVRFAKYGGTSVSIVLTAGKSTGVHRPGQFKFSCSGSDGNSADTGAIFDYRMFQSRTDSDWNSAAVLTRTGGPATVSYTRNRDTTGPLYDTYSFACTLSPAADRTIASIDFSWPSGIYDAQ